MGSGGEPDPLHVFSFSTALLVGVMILWTTVGHKLAAKSKLIGEGSAACLMGLAVGLVLLLSERLFHPEVLQDILQFDPENFFVFFLPPIIFYAGLSVKKKHFFRNFFTIAGYGVVGTYICFALISTALYWFLGHLLSFGDCLALGAILAATDSVAALQVISQERFPLLYSVVFGEGVINDATSIVILGTLQDLNLKATEDLTLGVVLHILGEFVYLFVASALLGMAFGLLTAFCLRKMHIQHTAQEVALIGMTAYLSYLVGDVLHLSGILSLFVSAVAISHYALHNISSESRTTTIYSFQTLSYISEGIIFVYCGMDALDPLKWKNTDIKELLWMFWILIVLLVVTRAMFVAPVSLLHNRFAQHKLQYKEMIVIWWAGLMRGAVSVALVYYYFDPHGTTADRHTSTMITTTLIVVLISIMAFGAATKPLLERVMGPASATAAHGSNGKGGGVEMAFDPMMKQPPSSRRLGGNEYAALNEESEYAGSEGEEVQHSRGGGQDASRPAALQPAAGDGGSKDVFAEVPIYGDDDFSPMAGAPPKRLPSDTLHEVSIDPSPRSQSGPTAAPAAAASASPEAKRSQKLISGLKGIVTPTRGRAKAAEGNDDFLFEFEALARGKEAGGQSASGAGTAPAVHNLVADSRLPQASQPAAAAGVEFGGFVGSEESLALMQAPIRKESSGNDYAPDSKALLARVNRWWKRFDESHLQPVFGGPAVAAATAPRTGHGQESSQHGGSQHGGSSSLKPQGKSFTVPATSRRG